MNRFAESIGSLTLTIIFIFLQKVVAGLEPGIDLLESLQLHNSSRQGVSLDTGPQRLRPAFHLQGDYRDLRLPQPIYQKAVELLRRESEFTMAASLRQEEANSGTIVAFSHGYNRYLELQSSGRKNEIRLHYTSQHDSQVHVETFPFRLADNKWHKLAVSVSGSQVELLVDCHILYRKLIKPPDRNFTLPQLSLWVGQRNNKHSLFKGSLQDVRLIAGPHGYLTQCPSLDSSCPTCGQFSLLQNTIEQLSRHIQELSDRLVVAEGRIGKVEECDCQKSCRINGSIHSDGATWRKDCDICSCVRGDIQCRPVQCPRVTCKHPVINPGECCPSCLKQCLLRGELYDHGVSVNIPNSDGVSVNTKQCVECECRNGSMHCKRIDPNVTCPPLPCSPQEQFSVPGYCCKFCKGVDYCTKGHMCHENATCLNLQTTYTCQCNNGFSGDGHSCHDVDECQEEGGLQGHHCHSNTRCKNTLGSYVCECLPGYRRLDKFNCVELDECNTGNHACHEHATCVNTLGSYHCRCHDGYVGDGYDCKAICNQTCLNGGECTSPGRCSCRKGYVGPSCEFDLNECETNLHHCHENSVCINMPGWYYCKCKPGYRSILHNNSLGTMCQDIDECKEKLHTCHWSSRCVNDDGGFRCECGTDEGADCKLSCNFEGKEYENGISFSPNGNPCRRCLCKDGVVSCKDPVCNCSAPRSKSDKCCPQCDPNAACRHQELKHVVFQSGEKWIYQCQTCECLYGEIDCWPMECPPLTCSDPFLSPGDCCPRCDEDPCGLDSGNSSHLAIGGQPCTYAGKLYDSGSEWNDPQDKCTACNCKDGHLCCRYDIQCTYSNESSNTNRNRHNNDHSVETLVTSKTATNRVAGLLTSEAQVQEDTHVQNKNYEISNNFTSVQTVDTNDEISSLFSSESPKTTTSNENINKNFSQFDIYSEFSSDRIGNETETAALMQKVNASEINSENKTVVKSGIRKRETVGEEENEDELVLNFEKTDEEV